MTKLGIYALVAAGLLLLGYVGGQDRQDAMRDHAWSVCTRAQATHHVVAASFDIQKCVDWNTVHDEDDDR